MKINDLQPRQGSVEVEGVIVELGETRTYNKFGRELRVADAIIKDDSGNVKLTLWNDDIGRFKSGDRIKVINGYVNEFQGEMSLTSGKFGKIEKLEGGEVNESGESEDINSESKEDVQDISSEKISINDNESEDLNQEEINNIEECNDFEEINKDNMSEEVI